MWIGRAILYLFSADIETKATDKANYQLQANDKLAEEQNEKSTQERGLPVKGG